MLFSPSDGRKLGPDLPGVSSVYEVAVASDDPRLADVPRVQTECESRFGRSLYYGWEIVRVYTAEELSRALLLTLHVTKWFEPVGEMCGTTYDESDACRICGAGRKRSGPLRLDLAKVPRSADIASSIARDETVVTKAFVDAVRSAGLNPPSFEPVVHRKTEHTQSRRGAGSERWAMMPTAVIGWSDQTLCGIDPFDHDAEGRFVCPMGCTRGLNILSELFVTTNRAADGADFWRTNAWVGDRVGVIVPAPMWVISQRAYRVLRGVGLKGFRVEPTRIAAHSDNNAEDDGYGRQLSG